jgi:hypothetical protein
MADRGQWGLAYKAQGAFGTPATGTFALVPGATWNPGASFNRVEDNTATGNRLGAVGRAGTRPVAPRLTVPWRTVAFDSFLSSLFLGSWATDTLVQGTTKTWFTLEDRQPDVPYFGIYQDAYPNQMTLRMQPNALVEAEFQFLATHLTASGTGTTSPTAAVADTPFDTWDGGLTYGGATFGVSSFEVTFNNRAETRYDLFSRDPSRVIFNTDQVTGQFTAAFTGFSNLNDAINDTTHALVLTLTNGTKGHTITFPALHTSGWDAQITTDPERLQTINFEAEGVAGTKATWVRDNT